MADSSRRLIDNFIKRPEDASFVFGWSLAAVAVLCWSGNWIMGRAIRSEVLPFGLNFWRCIVASAVLLPVVAKDARENLTAFKGNWKIVTLLAFLGSAMFQTLVYFGLQSMEAINALLLNSTAPLYVILIAFLALNDVPKPQEIIGITISFVGALIVISRGDIANLSGLAVNGGDFIIILALVILGVYSVLLQFGPRGMKGVTLVFFMSLLGALFTLPRYVVEAVSARNVPISGSSIASISYAGIFASVIAYLCYNSAISRLGSSRPMFFFHLMPLFGSLLAVAILGESLRLYHLAGFLIILSGFLLATIAK